MQKPRYQHDCDKCRFLGHFNEFDLYACGQLAPGDEGKIFDKIVVSTVIGRRSNDGGDYCSGTAFAFLENEVLRQAMARVIYRSADFIISDSTKAEAWRFIIEPMLQKTVTTA